MERTRDDNGPSASLNALERSVKIGLDLNA
jgi:hypothetical protein